MQIAENIEKAPEEAVLLKVLADGDVFRYAHDTFEEALKTGLFYMKVKPWQANLTNKACIVSCDGSETLVRDDDHRVIKHPAEMLVRRKA